MTAYDKKSYKCNREAGAQEELKDLDWVQKK